jgi:hypothetical protein
MKGFYISANSVSGAVIINRESLCVRKLVHRGASGMTGQQEIVR